MLCLRAETCERLFTPDSPHIGMRSDGAESRPTAAEIVTICSYASFHFPLFRAHAYYAEQHLAKSPRRKPNRHIFLSLEACGVVYL
jgi:hypothetical protein